MTAVTGYAPPVASAFAFQCSTDSTGHLICNNTSGAGIFAGIGVVILVVYLALLVLGIIAYVKIITKAGYSGWWLLIGLVPLVGIVFFFIFAFSNWPVTREVQALRKQMTGSGGYGVGPGGYGGRSGPGGRGPGPFPPGSFPSGTVPPSSIPTAFVATGSSSTGSPAPETTRPGPTTETEHSLAHVPIPTFGQFIRGEPDPDPSPTADPSTAQSEQPGALPPAGWFPAPGGPPGQMRYWDGARWTDHYH
jgi:hypothetical protein